MPIIADTILPFDLGLKRFETGAQRALRLKREQEAQRERERLAALVYQQEQQQQQAAARSIEEQHGLRELSSVQLAALVLDLQSRPLTANEAALLDATRLVLVARNPTNPNLPFDLLQRPTVTAPRITAVSTPTGTRIVTDRSTVGLLSAAGAIGATVAPAKDGGTVGVQSAAIIAGASAVVTALTQLERYSSANPGDP